MKRYSILSTQILILILNTSITFSQSQSSKNVCVQFPEIQDDFNNKKENYHEYNVETYICNTDDYKSATKELIFSYLLKDVRYAAPTFVKDPVVNCGKVVVNLGAITVDLKSLGDYLPGNDPIVTVIDKSSCSVINYTLPDHRLHAGKVVRSIVQRGNEFYITSWGTGNNKNFIFGKINANKSVMNMIWHAVDGPFTEDVRRFLQEMENAKGLYGTWKGTASYGGLGSEKITFKIEPGKELGTLKAIKNTFKNGKNYVDILDGTMSGLQMKVPFNVPFKNRNNGFCNGFLFFQKQNEKIEVDFGSDDENCEPVHFVLYKDGSPNQPAPSEVPRTFKIKSKDVTIHTDKDFKWYSWDKAPEDLKIAAQFIHSSKNRQTQNDILLSDQIDEYLADKGAVKIAAVDLDGDGICGLAVFAEGSIWCGTAGCTFELFDNGGLSTVDLGTDHGPRPTQNGVRASTGRFFALKPNSLVSVEEEEVKKLFTYDNSKKVVLPVKSPFTGGSTPFELARILLKALQTNDKKLWASCIHPETSAEFREDLVKRFDDFRDGFTGQGVENWKLVTFSRVGFQAKVLDGEKLADVFDIEFYYNNREFVGQFSLCGAKTYKNKNYGMVVPCFGDTKLTRNVSK